jgi:cytoskeletal protein RodZ
VPPPKKRGIGKFFAIGCGSLAALVILVIVIAAVASGGHSTSSDNTASSSNSSSSSSGTSTSSSQNSSGNTVAKVGQTITVDGIATTLLSVQKLSVGAYDTPPKSGDEYVVVQVKMVNTGPNEVAYNEYDFHVENGSGNITDSTFTTSYNSKNGLNSGNLAAGGSVTGGIPFEVPIGDHQAKLTWQPSIFGNSTTYSWNLGL